MGGGAEGGVRIRRRWARAPMERESSDWYKRYNDGPASSQIKCHGDRHGGEAGGRAGSEAASKENFLNKSIRI